MTFNLNKSEKAYLEAKKYLPSGVNSPVRSFKSIGLPPPFIKRGKNANLTDIDGNNYIDYCLSWGALILGHANSEVVKKVQQSITRGTSFGTCSLPETELAKIIIKAIPSMEIIRFVNSGTEAVMSALRLARAYTKKNIIIKFDGCYHGHHDTLLINAGSGVTKLPHASSLGIPKNLIKDTISIPFNNLKIFEQAIKKHKNKIAAVIVEPIPANMGLILPQENFLKQLRQITQENNILLIFDEVITGFRLCFGGAQNLFKIKPDITCLGKIIGGGFPVGAYGADKRLMNLLAPQGAVYQAGTLSGNPVAMTAGITTLTILQEKNFFPSLEKKSRILTSGIEKLIEKKPLTLNKAGSMFTLFFSKSPVNNYTDAHNTNQKNFKRFYTALLQEGIYFSPSAFETNFISSAHQEKDFKKTLKIIEIILKKI